MNLRYTMKKIATELNMCLKTYKLTGRFKSTCARTVSDTSNYKDFPLLSQQLNIISHFKSQTEKPFIILPQINVGVKKSITEPEPNIKINFKLPIRNGRDTKLELPHYVTKEITEPEKQIIRKEAVHMIFIRKKKMKKHKYKKFLKKHRVEIAKYKLKCELEEEARLQNSLREILKETETYTPEKYMEEILKIVHWEKPVTKVRGFLAPQDVIKKHLEEKERQRILNERIEECRK